MKRNYIILIIIALALIAFFISKKNIKRLPQSQNPYKYELGDLNKTNPEDICYKETDSIILKLDDPKSISIDGEDNVFILGIDQIIGFDRKNNKILEFKITKGAYSFSTYLNDMFYVAYDRHIEVYNKKGDKLATWDTLTKPSMLSSVAVNQEFVYVSDAGKAVLHKYDKKGNYLLTIAEKDTTKGIRGCILPSRYFDVALSEDQIWLVNSGRLSVENYTQDGEFRSYWGIALMKMEGFCGCCNPSNIAILPNGYFVTSEKGIPRVKIYDHAGNFKCVVTGPENFSHGSIGRDIAINSKSQVYLLDSPHNKVRIFSQL